MKKRRSIWWGISQSSLFILEDTWRFYNSFGTAHPEMNLWATGKVPDESGFVIPKN